jgi:hypothetical protein
VASHALRSVFYQLAWLSAIFVGWTVTFALMAVLIGFLLVPVMILVTLAPFVQASYEAYRVYGGGRHRHYCRPKDPYTPALRAAGFHLTRRPETLRDASRSTMRRIHDGGLGEFRGCGVLWPMAAVEDLPQVRRGLPLPLSRNSGTAARAAADSGLT